jgi:hypothetical protein
MLRGGVLRWRLETYGLYMPSLPNARPWWRINARAFTQLVRHGGNYAAWLVEIEALGKGGPRGWWQAHLGQHYASLRSYMDRVNRVDADDPLDNLP